MFRLYHTSYKHVQNVQFKILLKLWKKLDFQILLLESWVAWWVTSWRVRQMTAFIVSRIFGACGWLHYTLRKTLFQPMLNSVYNTLVWGHSKIPLPRNCQSLDPPPPYVTISYFLVWARGLRPALETTPSPECYPNLSWQKTSEKQNFLNWLTAVS